MTEGTTDAARLQEATANCARERIDISGAIQPHGHLISCDMVQWRIAHVSSNLGELFDEDSASLLGLPLSDLLDDLLIHRLREAASNAVSDDNAQYVAAANIGVMARLHEVSVHVAQGLLHIEFEPHGDAGTAQQALSLAHPMITHVEAGIGPEFFHQRVAENVRNLIGYDRAMIYRFGHDGSGEVIAESCAEDVPGYLGQRFPASDIPPQARALYLRNRVRVIPDSSYAPVPILPGKVADGSPMDLSRHLLRSVSPVHLEYLRNMGVAASMSISIVVRGQLWGLIACHHRSPRGVASAERVAAELLCLFVSLHLSAEEATAEARAESAAEVARDALALRLAAGNSDTETLADSLQAVAGSLRCDGVAAFLQGRWLLHGAVPDETARVALQHWADAQPGPVFASEQGKDWHPDAEDWPVAGALGIAIGSSGDYVFGFRNEQVRQVRWAGQPEKLTVASDDGIRIAPRRSFAEWQESVRGASEPWDALDLRLGLRLHTLLKGYALASPVGKTADELDAFRRRQLLQQSRGRLQHLTGLLQQLVAGGMSETAPLDARLAALEAELEALEVRPQSGE